MSPDDNPLDHLPDPSKRFQVLAMLRRDTDVDIEIVDVVTKQGVVVPLLQALEIAPISTSRRRASCASSPTR